MTTPPPRMTRTEWRVAAFTAAYMLVWLGLSLFMGNREFLFYFVVMCCLITAAFVIHRRVGFHPAALWGLSCWGLAHMAGGLMPVPATWPVLGETHVLYNLWLVPGVLKYDQFVHAMGFGLVTWICWQALVGAFRSRGTILRPSFGLLVLCAAAGQGFGAANEVVEFFAVLTLPGTNVGGYENTGWDMVANAIGSIMAAALIGLFAKREPAGN